MIKRMKNKLFVTICVAALSLGAVVPSTFSTVHASGTKTVYVDVEKNITGQAPILQPVQVSLDDTKTVLDATETAVGASNIDAASSSYGSYVKAFKDNTASFTYAYTSQIPAICYDTTTAYNQPIVSDSNYLREKEYNGISGWMFTVNNTDHDSSYNYYTADTALSSLPDGAVIRWEFSMASGCDLGLSGYLPNGTVTGGYYNWNTSATAPFFTRTDKTALITKLATTAKPASGATGYDEYVAAENALKNLTISQTSVDDVLDDLNAVLP
ncbi:hypothetical protein JMF89_06425 [Clostridiaceae bacterium UIB06]|uniref:DUF4430 domain-containing protein n=1 Tax=Clostridium thailandense TaxID=2794346 RepID=A0A949TTR8_9CLOT|nr:hypothetical protein [Clostridium thailandense]MBV7275202.1 hypothetical protein [Clostridium thailandense]MCH5136838.1 hypothetical protein [Clostridiaceae bacterium UIB06]